jgi:hypothetical protein
LPSVTNLTKVGRLTTLPETRRAIVSAVRTGRARDLVWRASHDRGGLLRELRDPTNAVGLVRTAVRHPATRELGSASFMFMPGRYLTVGWAAMWAGRRLFRHSERSTRRGMTRGR